MTPGARIAAAIGVLDQVLDDAPVERVLTTWARKNRYAGSSDRAALRDLVFDAIRCRRSFTALGGAETGRGLMIGACRANGQAVEDLFTGQGYAPGPLDAAEQAPPPALADLPPNQRLDCPDWLAPALADSLGADFEPVLQALRQRAPVFLRANRAKTTRDAALTLLAQDGITGAPHPLSQTAIEITENPRKIKMSQAYLQGFVELQDAASQAVIDRIGLPPGARILDFCAGGGGKALALAARPDVQVFAHDANPARMQDLPGRATRAGVRITVLSRAELDAAAPFDLVLADAPCSGSGAWRRSPQGKWDLTPEHLDELCAVQAGILDEIVGLVVRGGQLAYATCSLLNDENIGQIDAFLARNSGWHLRDSVRLTPLDGGDGFFLAVLTRGKQGG